MVSIQRFWEHYRSKGGWAFITIDVLFFINDLAKDLHIDSNDVFQSNGFIIYLLLFADDTVLFAKSPETLQLLLDKLYIYCNKWNITVNINNTKVVAFRNGTCKYKYNWTYGDQTIEIVDSYIYTLELLYTKMANFFRLKNAYQNKDLTHCTWKWSMGLP